MQKREGKIFERLPLFSSAENILIGKDLGAIWRNKGVRALLMLLPVVLVVVIPLVYSVGISFIPIEGNPSFPEPLAKLLGNPQKYTYRQLWMGAFTTLLCPMLFLCVPILCSVIAASQVFVREKEEGTLETLFLSSLDATMILHAKILCCTLLSIAISAISFVAFAITVSVADLCMGAPYFLNLRWIVCLVLLMPVVALFSVIFVCWELPRVYSFVEALQTMGYLLLPLLLLFLVQLTGVFEITVPVLLVIVVLLGVASILLFNRTNRLFQPEKLFPGTGE